MNALNHAVNALFDVLLWPFDQLGRPAALVLASGVFGVLALLAFKHVSPQRAIKAAKDRIKARLIEIRIYQDDLRLVGRAILGVLGRNLQYLGLNLLPFVPLAIPFVFVLAQFVVRYGFDPVPLHASSERWLAGAGTTISIELKREHAADVRELTIGYSEGVRPVSPLVRVPSEGRAYQEIAVSRDGEHEIAIRIGSAPVETKRLVAGDAHVRAVQGSRGSGVIDAWLWPAEDGFDATSPLARVSFDYPDSDLGWLPGGPGGVVIVFLVSSMLFGALAIKPLRVQI